jgi:hypothetical protein
VHRLGFPFDLKVSEVLPPEEPLAKMLGLPADHDLSWLCQAHEPGREVGRVAHGRVVHAEVSANGAHHHDAGVEAHPYTEFHTVRATDVLLKRLQALADPQRGAERSVGMVLVGDGGSEERHDAVTEKLIDVAFVAVNCLQHDLERPVHNRVDVFGVQFFGDRREAAHIHEHHGDVLALALHGALGGEDLLGEVLWRVGGG